MFIILSPKTEVFIDQLEKYTFIKEMIRMEHRRWNYFSAVNGWGYIKQSHTQKDKEHKLHPCMSNYEILAKNHPEKVVYDLMPLLVKVKENNNV